MYTESWNETVCFMCCNNLILKSKELTLDKNTVLKKRDKYLKEWYFKRDREIKIATIRKAVTILKDPIKHVSWFFKYGMLIRPYCYYEYMLLWMVSGHKESSHISKCIFKNYQKLLWREMFYNKSLTQYSHICPCF